MPYGSNIIFMMHIFFLRTSYNVMRAMYRIMLDRDIIFARLRSITLDI